MLMQNLHQGRESKLSAPIVCCVSTDYIVTQPRGDAKQWQGVVTKMMKVYGAVINERDAQAIVEYLVSAHGSTN